MYDIYDENEYIDYKMRVQEYYEKSVPRNYKTEKTEKRILLKYVSCLFFK
jgi:hypothetical protein